MILARIILLLGLALWMLVAPSAAHELRPGYLEIRQESGDRYVVRFKVPALGDMRLSLHVRLPADCVNLEPPRTESAGSGMMDRLHVSCSGGLDGRDIAIDGLADTYTDVIARVARLDGTVQSARITPDQPTFEIGSSPTWLQTAKTYFLLGVEHILGGVDHLMFVLALLLLIRDRWMLLKTITAFTIAHSITLAAAALNWMQISQAPVEATIALSICFAAAEVVRLEHGEHDLANRAPWIMAFAFGLLHGFGFGGALKQIGLPQSDVPLALVTFNLGVEAGQLMFVGAVLALVAVGNRLLTLRLHWIRDATAYVIGSVAAVWFIERTAAAVL
jgi:hydrogenase/urease accessory protein HupE